MASPHGLVQRLDQELHRSGLLPRGGWLLVAVSGGADSVALLRLLAAVNGSAYWRWKLVVGHVDHGLRGWASAGDARFVRALAKDLGLPFEMRRLRLKGAAKGRVGEDAARQGRLVALAGMAKRRRCVGVVMAHHADDQAETVVMRMCRGCGLEGLAGMAAETRLVVGRRGMTVYRPLLGVRRADLRAYLAEVGQAWREDATNAAARYRRNRVRAEVLPAMEAVFPGAAAALGRLAALAGEGAAVVAARVREAEAGAVMSRSAGRVVLRRKELKAAVPLVAGEVVRAAVEAVGGTREIADFERVREAVRVIGAAAGGKVVELGKGVVARVGGGVVTVERTRGRKRGTA